MELEPVLYVWINHDHDLVDLTLTTINHAPHSAVGTKTSETIHTNQKHPFFTKEQGFLPVGQITLGMHVLRADGTYGVVTGWRIVPGTKVMYNLEVAQDHTFTVGDGQWVVHNCGVGGGGEIVTNHPDAQSAYNHAMNELGGPLGENARLTQAKGLGGDTSVEGLNNGMREGRRSWRLDYDESKGPHFNWELGKKSSGGIWGAATFPGTYDDYINMLLQFNEGGVEMMLGL